MPRARLAPRCARATGLLLLATSGACKTTFVKGWRRDSNRSGRRRSPTFTLLHEYGAGASRCTTRTSTVGQDGDRGSGAGKAGVRDGVLAIEWPIV